jgi:hypothetical protein
MEALSRLGVALFPAALSVLFAWLLMEGFIGLGGGEKDIFLALPMLLWSVAFAVSCLVFWVRRTHPRRSALLSAGYATTILFVSFLGLLGAMHLWAW